MYELYLEVEEGRRPEPETSSRSLEEEVYFRLCRYAERLQGHLPENLYDLVMPQLERPLIRIAMEQSSGRQARAAEMLGIHRNTLRTRLAALGLSARMGRK